MINPERLAQESNSVEYSEAQQGCVHGVSIRRGVRARGGAEIDGVGSAEGRRISETNVHRKYANGAEEKHSSNNDGD